MGKQKLTKREAKLLSEELAELTKAQFEALQNSSYLRTFIADAGLYDQRRLRIEEISKLLAEFKRTGD
jgi:hypothetical protein